jgi:hypothetical protein
MPVAAVALAATSFAAGATAFAAATTLAGSIAAGAMMVGGALTIVGTVTSNAKLAKIGGVLSLAGGLGTLAVNAAAEAGKAAVGEVAADAASGVATDAAASAATTGVEAGNLAGVETAAVDLGGTEQFALNEVGGGASSSLSSPMPMTDVQAQGMLNSQVAGPAPLPDAAAIPTTGAADTAVGQAAQTNAGQAAQTNANAAAQTDALNGGWVSAEGGAGYNAGMAVDAIKDPGMFAKFEAWSKANPATAKLLMEGGKGMLGALATSPKDQAMIDYYKANADQIKRKTLWGSGRIA